MNVKVDECKVDECKIWWNWKPAKKKLTNVKFDESNGKWIKSWGWWNWDQISRMDEWKFWWISETFDENESTVNCVVSLWSPKLPLQCQCY